MSPVFQCKATLRNGLHRSNEQADEATIRDFLKAVSKKWQRIFRKFEGGVMSTLKDLNTHLFAQLDRLAKADKSELDAEVKRAQTIAQVSEQIVDAHKTQLDAVKLVAQYKGLNANQETPKIAVSDMDVEV